MLDMTIIDMIIIDALRNLILGRFDGPLGVYLAPVRSSKRYKFDIGCTTTVKLMKKLVPPKFLGYMKLYCKELQRIIGGSMQCFTARESSFHEQHSSTTVRVFR